ncbi:MAG: hypothetical protein ACJA2S_002541 [Cyclobacteriaceae bacterium]|jgi:hypothetical protein
MVNQNAKNGQDQTGSREYKAINSTFKATSKRVIFSTHIAGVYPDEASVNKWVRSYELERGKNFKVRDNYELSEISIGSTTLNLMAYCKVSEISSGTLHRTGDGFI